MLERVWRKGNLPTLLVGIQVGIAIWGFPGGTSGKESSCNAEDIRDVDWIPGSGRSPGGGHGDPLQHSGLENSMNRGNWQAINSPWGPKEFGHD